jgi:hypothetical protein
MRLVRQSCDSKRCCLYPYWNAEAEAHARPTDIPGQQAISNKQQAVLLLLLFSYFFIPQKENAVAVEVDHVGITL